MALRVCRCGGFLASDVLGGFGLRELLVIEYFYPI